MLSITQQKMYYLIHMNMYRRLLATISPLGFYVLVHYGSQYSMDLKIVPTDLEPGTGYTMIKSFSLFVQIHFLHSSNRQCLSYLLPLCKNESKCKIIHMTSTAGSLTHSYVKCFAQRLVLKQRRKETFIHELLIGAFDLN